MLTAAAHELRDAARAARAARLRSGDHRAVGREPALRLLPHQRSAGRVFSNQQVMVFIGFGLGIALGGAIGSHFGWRAAFLVVGPPSLVGRGPRVHVEGTEARRTATACTSAVADDDDAEVEHVAAVRGRLPPVRRRHGARPARRLPHDLADHDAALRARRRQRAHVHRRGHRRVATAVPRTLLRHDARSRRRSVVGALIILGGIPGVLFGGHARRPVRDTREGRARRDPRLLHLRRATRSSSCRTCRCPRGASVLLPTARHLRRSPPRSPRCGREWPTRYPRTCAARASARSTSCRSSSARPRHRSSSARSPTSGTCASRSSIVSPPVYVGAWILFIARNHLDADAMKIFEAVVRAMQVDEARRNQSRGEVPGP